MKNEKANKISFYEKPKKDIALLSDSELKEIASDIAEEFVNSSVENKNDALFLYQNRWYDYAMTMDWILPNKYEYKPVFSDEPTSEQEERYNYFYSLIDKKIDKILCAVIDAYKAEEKIINKKGEAI